MSLQEAECEDARIEYIANITKLTLNVDSGLWAELMWKEDNQMIIKDFLDSPTTKLLFLYTKNGKLSVDTDFSQMHLLPTKSIYFLKYAEIAIPMTDFRQHFMRGTLSSLPLMQYQAIYEKVMVPVLCNPDNNTKWPAEVTEDIVSHVQEFRNALDYCLGQARGRTQLPVPDAAKNVMLLDIDSITSASTSDENVRFVLDSIGTMVDNWTILVNEILKAECKQSASDPSMYGPMSEIIYWKERKENLKFIFNQIDDPVVKRMAKMLENAESCYIQAFKKLIRDVSEALAEAEDISTHLEKLMSHFELLDECEFPNMCNVLPDVMKTITTSWKQSRYFGSSPSRIAVLLQKICNLLIKQANKFLNGKNLFIEERKTSKQKIILAQDTVDLFVESYYQCQNEMESTFAHAKLYPWDFPDERVFKRLKSFYQRLKIIHDLFEAADTFHLIPKFELKGLQQTLLKLHLDDIFYDFCELYQVFEEAKYDPLDLENKTFEIDYQIFFAKICDLDCRLGSSISKACVESSSTEEAFKLIEALKAILERIPVETEFKSCVPSLISKVNEELLKAKLMYDDMAKLVSQKGYYFVYKNMPSIPSILHWALELKEKITSSVTSLKSIDKYFVTAQDAELEYQAYDKLMELLTVFENNIFQQWTEDAETLVNKKLNQPMLVKGEEGKYILNYDLEVSEVITEAKILQKIGHTDIPHKVLTLSESDEVLHYAHSFMFSTINWYNKLNEDLVPFERILIAEQWDQINNLLCKGLEIKWTDSGLHEYAETIYTITKALFINVNKTKENINEVKEMIEPWSSRPLYSRKTPNAPVDFRIQMNNQVRQQYNEIKRTAQKMRDKMEENLELFHCDSGSKSWKEYVKYLETILEDGLKDAAACSLKYLLDNTDSENTKLAPFIILYLKLDDDGIVFVPPVVSRESGSLLKCFEGVAEKIIGMSGQITRMTDETSTYEKTLQKMDALTHLKTCVTQHIVQATAKAQQAVYQFRRFEDFWFAEIQDILEDFVMYGPPAVYDIDEEDEYFDEENLEEIAKDATPPVEFKPPTEDEFRAQIAHFEMLYRQADELEHIITVEPWLIIDISSFKESLLALIRQWITAYKQKLVEQKSLGKLRKIIKEDME